MSSLATQLRERAASRVAVSADAVALGAVAVLLAVVAAIAWGTWGDLDSDTGYDIVAGIRIADGDLPYADFTYFYGPLSAFLSGLTVLVGGGGFGAAVVVGLAITTAIVAATYALARTQAGPLGAALDAAIAIGVAYVPGNYSYVLPHTTAATLGTLGLLVLLLCLYRRRLTGGTRWLYGAGTALGCLLLTKPEPLAAGLVAAAVWLVLEERDSLARSMTYVAAPAIAIALTAYGLLSLASSPGDILFENLWPRDVLAAGGNTLVEARMPLTIGSFAWLAGVFAAYVAGTAVLVLVGKRIRLPLATAVALGVTLATAAAVVEPDKLREAMKWAWAWLPAGAIVAVAVLALRRRRAGRGDAAASIALPAAAALAVVAFTTYRGFYLNATRPQMAVYYAPLAAVLVARLHLVDLAKTRSLLASGALWVAFLAAAATGLSLHDARAESATVSGPGGSLAETPREAALYDAALTRIDAAAPGKVLFGPLLTGLYVLSERESPLREISFLPSALPTAAAEQAAVERLERAAVPLIVLDRREWPGYGHGRFGETFGTGLQAWITREYELTDTLRSGGSRPRTLEIWTTRRAQ